MAYILYWCVYHGVVRLSTNIIQLLVQARLLIIIWINY